MYPPPHSQLYQQQLLPHSHHYKNRSDSQQRTVSYSQFLQFQYPCPSQHQYQYQHQYQHSCFLTTWMTILLPLLLPLLIILIIIMIMIRLTRWRLVWNKILPQIQAYVHPKNVYKKNRFKPTTITTTSTTSLSSQTLSKSLLQSQSNDGRWKRKNEFLQQCGDKYGYSSSPRGHIDTWRHKEFPHLIPPLFVSNANDIDNVDDDNNNNEPEAEAEVYLDYAGAALPSQSQMQQQLELNLNNMILGNPHSTGPAAHRTSLQIQKVKQMISHHFGCECECECESDETNNHPGYDILFTSGTTQALQIIATYFPWYNHPPAPPTNDLNTFISPPQSTLLYAHNVHTSVIGMRGPAMAQGARFLCQPLQDVCHATPATFAQWQQQHTYPHSYSHQYPVQQHHHHHHHENDGSFKDKQIKQTEEINHLLVLPLECNFGGTRPDLSSLDKTLQSINTSNTNTNYHLDNQRYTHKWYTLLDIAKAAATSHINLCDLNPDFACVSFYKLFGYPTGIGALFVKRSCIPMLLSFPSSSPIRSNSNISTLSSFSDSEYVNRTGMVHDDNNDCDENDYDHLQKHTSNHRYFGGGSVNVVLASQNVMVPRGYNSTPTLDSLTHGTSHFRGIVALKYGFQELNALGGMKRVSFMIYSIFCHPYSIID